jgi:hypothetical protein
MTTARNLPNDAVPWLLAVDELCVATSFQPLVAKKR